MHITLEFSWWVTIMTMHNALYYTLITWVCLVLRTEWGCPSFCSVWLGDKSDESIPIGEHWGQMQDDPVH